MRAYLAFTKKEFMESFRTYKLFIMLAVFLLFGMMSPVFAKITPDLLKEFMTEGISITIPEPTAIDAWGQFFKNNSQMGLIVLVIIFSGIISNEKAKGTLINIVTKGLDRKIIILSKFTASVVIWTIAYSLSAIVSYFYTIYFFGNESLNYLFQSILYLWIFGILLISIIILGGVLFKNNYGSLLFTGAFVAILFLLNIFPKLKEYNPIYLVSNNLSLIQGQLAIDIFNHSSVISLILVISSIIFSVLIFNKRQL